LTIASVLLLSTALAAPAFAQIEEVVVTAQKKSEDIQTVPIAISAFTAQDLASKQIKGFSDIQFNMPSVTVTNGTFGSSNFTIRGIGSAAVATSGDAGVSINQNEVYLANDTVTADNYFDLEGIEVLRGPQGTLFGQNATGGAVNIKTAKPQLDAFSADLEGTYGNYNDQEVRAMVNIPIVTDQLAVRAALYWQNRDGDITNIYGNGLPSHIDSRDLWDGRFSTRWQPTDDTTVDLMFQHQTEDDSRVRTVVQACTTDYSAVLGCLPGAIKLQPVNLDATANTLLTSDIGILGNSPFQLTTVTGATPDNVGTNSVIPKDLHTVNTDFQPQSRGSSDMGTLTWKQNLFGWLTSTFIAAFEHGGGTEQQATEETVSDKFSSEAAYGSNYVATPTNCAALYYLGKPISNDQRHYYTCGVYAATSGAVNNAYLAPGTSRVVAMQTLLTGIAPTNAGILTAGGFGYLPISAPVGYGLSTGHVYDYADHDQSLDQIGGPSHETSLEWRFTSSFNGPFNFLLGANYLDHGSSVRYYVGQTGLDVTSDLAGYSVYGDGTLYGPSIYDSINEPYKSTTRSIFGEAYYDIIPDTLKFTGGLRYSEDTKSINTEQVTLGCPFPVGTTDSGGTNILNNTCPAGAGNPFNPYGTAASETHRQNAKYDALTGRAVLTWTPKIDWTDQTMVYASYAHGNRPGGFNPPSFIPGLTPNTFAPENVDAYELGTKNTLLDGTLQANLTGWYYDYKGYQVSSIVNRSSLNVNLNATLYGVEGEFNWAPDTHWLFNANFGFTHSEVANGQSLVDTRNPTHGSEYAMVLKDFQGSNCIIQSKVPLSTLGGSNAAVIAAINAQAEVIDGGTPILTAAPAALPGSVAPYSAFVNANAVTGTFGLSCSTLGNVLAAINHYEGGQYVVTENTALEAYLHAAPGTQFLTPGGIATSLGGNQLPNTPAFTFSVGAQYTFDLDGGYSLVPRVDYYWKSSDYARVFNTVEDKISSWDEVNAQIQLNSPDNFWYARGWIKNALNKKNITGSYTGSDSQGLFTNLFVEEPRTYGITLGAHF
jgi:outer membrane receptor protein involved in Fe transport